MYVYVWRNTIDDVMGMRQPGDSSAASAQTSDLSPQKKKFWWQTGIFLI